MEIFGEWLRTQRTRLHLTREQFADRVSCSAAYLRKIEDGERRPSAQIAELIANALEIPPAERATFVKVARGELSVARLSSTPRPAATTAPRVNLPLLPTPLIGRQFELDDLLKLLHDPECRLLTLVGPGGIGKTRLAIEAAARLQDSFADGVYFSSFAPVNTSRYMVPVLADSLGFAFESSSRADPKAQLFGYLKQKQVLLVADNLEHLLAEPGIELLAELLGSAQQVKLLATSRESLGLQGEWVYEVPGLPIPDSHYAAGSEHNTAVELFMQRARRANVGFSATLEDYPAIVRICQLVDGMPLGIELAAAWVRMLSCEEIAAEIEGGLDFLSVSARDLPPRHRSMRAVFDHSWKLLAEDEQIILARLASFRGGFQREAAQQVANATLPVLSALVTKSLLRRSGDGRYDLHDLVRQFAAQRLMEQPEEQEAALQRHAAYYLAFFKAANARLAGSAQTQVISELTTERENFRAAWEWAAAHGEFALIEQTLRAFARLYDSRGWYQEGLEMLDSAIYLLETDHPPKLPDRDCQVALAHLLAYHAYLSFRQTQVEQARVMLDRSLEILRPLDEDRLLVEALAFLGLVMIWTGNYSRALELLSEGLQTSKKTGDRWFEMLCLTQHANVSVMMGNFDLGHTQLLSAVAGWRQIGDIIYTAYALNLLSLSALALGRHAEARHALEECVALNQSVGDRWGLGFGYQGLGRIAQAQDQHALAVEMYDKALQTFTELGARRDVARALAEMGRSLFALGNDAEAGRLWREACQISRETQGSHVALEALVGIARLQSKHGNLERALQLLWTVSDHPATVQETRDRAAALRLELEGQLSARQVEAARAESQAKPFESVINEILSQPG